MKARFVSLFSLAACVGSLLTTLPAHAQDKEPSDEPGKEEVPEAAKPEAPASGEAGKDDTEAKVVADAEAGGSPVENKGQTYHFVGLRYRGIIVPKFMMNLFGDGGDTVYVHAFGPEFAIRKDAFEYDFSLWYASYAMDPTPFKASSDPEQSWELVESEIKVIFLTADFLWSQEFSPEFAFNYGLGAGFGIVFGDLKRVQAYKDANGDYQACAGVGRPNGFYCDDENDHYGDYTEPSWANGGSKPILFPWFVLQTGLRYKPHRNFVARLDAGFGTSGFFFGIGADYGL